jgi:hypothetical protein
MVVTDRAVAIALRFFAAIDLLALGAVLMPFGWMGEVHAWLGLGTLPEAPIVEYLARHVSLLYVVHAATNFFLSAHVERYRPVIGFIAALVAMSACILGVINVVSGQPLWWAIAEFIGGAIEGVTILVLLRLSRAT